MAFGGFQVGPYQINFQQLGANVQPAAGPGVVLFPRTPLAFRTRADLALYALAVYTKDCAVRARTSFDPLIPLRTVSFRDAVRV